MDNMNTATATTAKINNRISLDIMARMEQGADVLEAMRLVLGAERVTEMIDALYTELRQKGGQ